MRTTFDDGSFGEVRYDALGRKVAESQQVAKLTNGAATQLVWSDADRSFKNNANGALVPTRLSEYDAQGRLTAVELPAINNVRPRYSYAYCHWALEKVPEMGA